MYLRKLEEKDADFMLEWMHDQNVVGKMAADFVHMTIEDCLSFIQKANADESKALHRAICTEDDEYLGTISLKNISREDENAEYAIILSRKAMGKGIAAQASVEILKIAFQNLSLHKIYLYVKESNVRAIKFYEKFGFRREGVFIDHIKEKNGSYENLIWMAVLNDEFISIQSRVENNEQI